MDNAGNNFNENIKKMMKATPRHFEVVLSNDKPVYPTQLKKSLTEIGVNIRDYSRVKISLKSDLGGAKVMVKRFTKAIVNGLETVTEFDIDTFYDVVLDPISFNNSNLEEVIFYLQGETNTPSQKVVLLVELT